jgi:hypothetical protein
MTEPVPVPITSTTNKVDLMSSLMGGGTTATDEEDLFGGLPLPIGTAAAVEAVESPPIPDAAAVLHVPPPIMTNPNPLEEAAGVMQHTNSNNASVVQQQLEGGDGGMNGTETSTEPPVLMTPLNVNETTLSFPPIPPSMPPPPPPSAVAAEIEPPPLAAAVTTAVSSSLLSASGLLGNMKTTPAGLLTTSDTDGGGGGGGLFDDIDAQEEQERVLQQEQLRRLEQERRLQAERIEQERQQAEAAAARLAEEQRQRMHEEEQRQRIQQQQQQQEAERLRHQQLHDQMQSIHLGSAAPIMAAPYGGGGSGGYPPPAQPNMAQQHPPIYTNTSAHANVNGPGGGGGYPSPHANYYPNVAPPPQSQSQQPPSQPHFSAPDNASSRYYHPTILPNPTTGMHTGMTMAPPSSPMGSQGANVGGGIPSHTLNQTSAVALNNPYRPTPPPVVPPGFYTKVLVTEPLLLQSAPALFGLGQPPHWSYQVTTELSAASGTGTGTGGVWMVRRRFRHVVALEDRLREDCPGAILPPRYVCLCAIRQ